MERNEERIRKKKIDLIVKVEKEKWNLLKKHQEEKKNRKNDKSKYDKYIIQQPNQIRIVVLGESCSGKTSLIQRFINDRFDPEYKTTTRIEALKSELLFFSDQSFRVELIDTPPLENFYKNLEDILYFVQGVIFVFDASNKNSFLRMQDYFKITNFYEFQKIGIVATKKDICTEKNKYKFYQLKKFCELHNAIPYFLSSKNNKEEVADFINLLCPEIIPSLVEKKEVLNLQYPYTKSIKNNIPKRNYIDEEIIKKAKEEEAKVNYIYNIGNKNKQYKQDKHFKEDVNNLEEKKEELESFNDVIGNINIDLEKLFNKYRPESGSIKNDKKYKKNRYKNKNKNKTLEDGGEWVNVNIDNLVDEFLKTKTDLKKNKKEKKIDDKKLDEKKSSKNSSNNKTNSEKENKKSKKESLDEKEKEENKENKDDEKENDDDEDKKDNNKESKKEGEEENEENDDKNEQDMNDEYYENLYGDIYDFQQSLKNEVMREQENNNDD